MSLALHRLFCHKVNNHFTTNFLYSLLAQSLGEIVEVYRLQLRVQTATKGYIAIQTAIGSHLATHKHSGVVDIVASHEVQTCDARKELHTRCRRHSHIFVATIYKLLGCNVVDHKGKFAIRARTKTKLLESRLQSGVDRQIVSNGNSVGSSKVFVLIASALCEQGYNKYY